jgi:predicted DNA-binding transcriptional regulator AlpA
MVTNPDVSPSDMLDRLRIELVARRVAGGGMSATRYLSAGGVAEYLSISRAMVDIFVERGVLPKAIELSSRVKRWDRQAIDAALAAPASPVHPAQNVDDIVRGVADGLATERRPARSKAASGGH